MNKFFIFNGKDSRDFNIHLAEYPSATLPKERIEIITIPGRSGTLHIKEGEDVFDSYDIPLTLTALDSSRIPEIKQWLIGSGTLVFGNDLDYYHEACFTGQTDFTRIFREWRQATAVIEMQPFKQLVKMQKFSLTGSSSTQTINVKTERKSPFIAKLNISNTNSASIIINGITVSIRDAANTIVTVDTGKQVIYDSDGNNLLSKCSWSTLPYLNNGSNNIYSVGISKIELQTRGKFL